MRQFIIFDLKEKKNLLLESDAMVALILKINKYTATQVYTTKTDNKSHK